MSHRQRCGRSVENTPHFQFYLFFPHCLFPSFSLFPLLSLPPGTPSLFSLPLLYVFPPSIFQPFSQPSLCPRLFRNPSPKPVNCSINYKNSPTRGETEKIKDQQRFLLRSRLIIQKGHQKICSDTHFKYHELQLWPGSYVLDTVGATEISGWAVALCWPNTAADLQIFPQRLEDLECPN